MKTTTTTTTTTTAITFHAVARKNERVLVYDIRSALIDCDTSNLLSLVKAWIHMVDNGTVSDADVVRTVDELEKVAYVGKYASVNGRKDGKEGYLDVVTSGRVKAWLYTIRRNGYRTLDVKAEKGERPEEKAARVTRKTTVKLSAEDAELIKMVKALRDAGLSTDDIKATLQAKAAC